MVFHIWIVDFNNTGDHCKRLYGSLLLAILFYAFLELEASALPSIFVGGPHLFFTSGLVSNTFFLNPLQVIYRLAQRTQQVLLFSEHAIGYIFLFCFSRSFNGLLRQLNFFLKFKFTYLVTLFSKGNYRLIYLSSELALINILLHCLCFGDFFLFMYKSYHRKTRFNLQPTLLCQRELFGKFKKRTTAS